MHHAGGDGIHWLLFFFDGEYTQKKTKRRMIAASCELLSEVERLVHDLRAASNELLLLNAEERQLTARVVELTTGVALPRSIIRPLTNPWATPVRRCGTPRTATPSTAPHRPVDERSVSPPVACKAGHDTLLTTSTDDLICAAERLLQQETCRRRH